MDYDLTDVPAAYDRGHDHGPAVLEQWMSVVESHVDAPAVHDILDLACGTGKFAPSLATRFDATVVGIDPSRKMLRQAQQDGAAHGRVRLVCGYGEALPLRTQSVDMVFMSMVFHFFDKPVLVARECHRVLRPGGRLCLRAITREQIANYPYLPFFPGSRAVLEQQLPTVDATCAAFDAAGFRPVFAGIVVQQIAADYAAYADKLSSGADSALARLDPREFADGLTSIRAKHAEAGGTAPIVEPIDFLVFEKA